MAYSLRKSNKILTDFQTKFKVILRRIWPDIDSMWLVQYIVVNGE